MFLKFLNFLKYSNLFEVSRVILNIQNLLIYLKNSDKPPLQRFGKRQGGHSCDHQVRRPWQFHSAVQGIQYPDWLVAKKLKGEGEGRVDIQSKPKNDCNA